MSVETIRNADGSVSIKAGKVIVMTVERDGNRILWHWTDSDQTYVLTEEVASTFRDTLTQLLR